MLDDRHQALTKFYGHLVELFLAFVNFGLCRIVLYLIFLNDGRAFLVCLVSPFLMLADIIYLIG